ncbi:MAG: sigma-70 family RNA polymerase sigma factor [Acidobacteriota bacterium]
MQRENDRALIRAVLGGDPGAAEELARRLRPLAVGLARGRFGLDAHAAADVWQDVVVRLWSDDFRALRAWRGEGKLTTYVAVIVSRLCLRQRRTPRREAVAVEATPASTPDPLQHAEHGERRQAVVAALDGLSARDRLLLTLRYDDEREPREIARLLGLEPGTARKALHDARKRLRKRLRRLRPELFDDSPLEDQPRDQGALVRRELADEH